VSSPPVSSDIGFQLSNFQAVALDLYLVKPNLCARCMCSPVRYQAVAVLVQLQFLPMQLLLIRAQISHGACLSKAKRTYGKGYCESQGEHSAHDRPSPLRGNLLRDFNSEIAQTQNSFWKNVKA
jgi:hypothetical protein